MTALGTLSTMTVISVRGGIQTGATDRAHGVALYAAESGAAVAMDFLRTHLSSTAGWGAYISPSNTAPMTPLTIPGNTVASGATGNPLGADTGASYTVTILNNRDDTGFVGGIDADKRVVIHAVGYGPGGATAAIDWDVMSGTSTAQRPCNNLAQKGQGADNAGLSDCLGAVSGNTGATY
jgi:hypothetical protein